MAGLMTVAANIIIGKNDHGCEMRKLDNSRNVGGVLGRNIDITGGSSRSKVLTRSARRLARISAMEAPLELLSTCVGAILSLLIKAAKSSACTSQESEAPFVMGSFGQW